MDKLLPLSSVEQIVRFASESSGGHGGIIHASYVSSDDRPQGIVGNISTEDASEIIFVPASGYDVSENFYVNDMPTILKTFDGAIASSTLTAGIPVLGIIIPKLKTMYVTSEPSGVTYTAFGSSIQSSHVADIVPLDIEPLTSADTDTSFVLYGEQTNFFVATGTNGTSIINIEPGMNTVINLPEYKFPTVGHYISLSHDKFAMLYDDSVHIFNSSGDIIHTYSNPYPSTKIKKISYNDYFKSLWIISDGHQTKINTETHAVEFTGTYSGMVMHASADNRNFIAVATETKNVSATVTLYKISDKSVDASFTIDLKPSSSLGSSTYEMYDTDVIDEFFAYVKSVTIMGELTMVSFKVYDDFYLNNKHSFNNMNISGTRPNVHDLVASNHTYGNQIQVKTLSSLNNEVSKDLVPIPSKYLFGEYPLATLSFIATIASGKLILANYTTK